MRRETSLWFSGNLGHDMELIVYGHAGQAVLCFPSQDGRAGDWEGFGMVAGCADLLEAGRLIMIAVDGIDWQSWTNAGVPVGDRARRHDDYHRYIVEEVVPFARAESGADSVWLTGCSMGAFHAANGFSRRPDAIDGLIALSGLYQPTLFVGAYSDDHVYFNSPLYYLPGLSDPGTSSTTDAAGSSSAPARERGRTRRCATRARCSACSRRRSSRRPSTGATTSSITGTGGRRCCAITLPCSRAESRRRAAVAWPRLRRAGRPPARLYG